MQEEGQQPKQCACHDSPEESDDLRLHTDIQQMLEHRYTDAEQDVRCQYEDMPFHAVTFLFPGIYMYPVFNIDDFLLGQESVFGRVSHRKQAKELV